MNKCFIVIGLFVASFGWGQNKQLLYGFDDLPQSLLLNPATDVRFDRNIGIPLLSGIFINAGTTGINAFDIFQENASNTVNDRIRLSLDRLSTKDFVTINQQLEFLSFGWRNKSDLYFSGGLYIETDVISYIPRNFAILGYEGLSDENIGKEFNFKEFTVRGESVATWHFGISKKITKKLRLGARVKIYSSLIDFRSEDNSGFFITRRTPEGSNIYRHSVVNGNLSVQTAGYSELRNLSGENSSSTAQKILTRRIFFGGNLGLGVDLGFDYQLNNAVSISGSILDLGFIAYSKDTETYQVAGSYDLDGVQIEFPEDVVQDSIADGVPPYYENLIKDIENTFPLDSMNTSYTKLRPLKLNAGLNYGFNTGFQECDCYASVRARKYDNNIGLQLYGVKRPLGFQGALSVYYDKRIASFLRAKLTYTIDEFSFKNVGALVSFHAKAFNFYLAADNLIGYANLAKANSLSLQLGFQILLNKQRQ